MGSCLSLSMNDPRFAGRETPTAFTRGTLATNRTLNLGYAI